MRLEAIVDLLSALVQALISICVLAVELVAHVIVLVCEFLLIAVTQGLKAARERSAKRTESRQRRLQARQIDSEPDSAQKAEIPKGLGRNLGIAALILVLTGPLAWFAREAVEKRREQLKADTEQHVKLLADDFKKKFRAGNLDAKDRLLLKDTDPWGQRTELFVDRMKLGTLIVVRSCGEDRKRKTLDDQLAIRWVWVNPADAAKDGAKKQAANLKDKAKQLLDRFRNHKAGEEVADETDL
ncbi:MAG: hypothetical protein AB8G99_10665 [Planctomycetaceae bacterium]